jgi:hypothetical protein
VAVTLMVFFMEPQEKSRSEEWRLRSSILKVWRGQQHAPIRLE